MVRVSQKGAKGVPMAEAFITRFPLTGHTEAACTRVTVADFDQWSQSEGYYSLTDDQDTINKNRNYTKNRINHTARNEAWRASGHDPFQIEVRDHGVSYNVFPADASFKRKSVNVPKQIEALLGTKRQVVAELLSSVDFNSLSIDTRIEFRMLDTWLDRYANDIAYATAQIQGEFMKAQQRLASELAENRLTSGAAIKVIESNGHHAEEVEDALTWDVDNEADYLATLLEKVEPLPQGNDLLAFILMNSRFELSIDGGFTPDELNELVSAVTTRMVENE
jgi:hypothetical protein